MCLVVTARAHPRYTRWIADTAEATALLQTAYLLTLMSELFCHGDCFKQSGRLADRLLILGCRN